MQENAIFSVTELTQAIRKHLESKFFYVHVQGEVIDFKEQTSGHLYFRLKDTQAQIAAVFFRGDLRVELANMKRLPKNGDQVVINGELHVYPPRGNYQIVVRKLKYIGVGELLVKFQELKERLSFRGWFDSALKKALPALPKTIGVVTSPTGAVIQDILNVLSRRCRGFHLILNPVKVQGEGAAQEIARAINQFNQYQLADVIIIGRGGGSLEDLWPFNEEVVAQAIFLSKIPIISAVGHEIDISISDFVADVRAPTPSAAAEIVMVSMEQRERTLVQMSRAVDTYMNYSLKEQRDRLEYLRKQSIFSSPFSFLEVTSQKLDELLEEIDKAMLRLISIKKLQIESLKKSLFLWNPMQQVEQRKEKLSQLIDHLSAINPKNILKRGYVIPFRENRCSVIFSSKEIMVGQKMFLLMQDGECEVKVESTTWEK